MQTGEHEVIVDVIDNEGNVTEEIVNVEGVVASLPEEELPEIDELKGIDEVLATEVEEDFTV